jgi:hypothetical protein
MPILLLLIWQIFVSSRRKRQRARAKGLVAGVSIPGLDSDFYRVEKELARRGVARLPAESLGRWARRAVRDPVLACNSEKFQRLLALHCRYRFDPHGLTAIERESLRAEASSCLDDMASRRRRWSFLW